MNALLALAPCIAVCGAILFLRWSGLAAAALSTLVAAGLWSAGAFLPLETGRVANAMLDAGVLTLLAASMIVPGVLFIEASGRLDARKAISGLVHALALPVARAVVLITCSVGILVESLTGMGVSLLVTMPLLTALVDRRRAIVLGLVGMSLMPWGALAISALVGAAIAGLDPESYARAVFWQSGPVALMLPLLAMWFAPKLEPSDIAVAAWAGLALVTAIAITSSAIGIEIAGIAGALAVGLVLAGRRFGPEARQWLAHPAIRAYLILILAVLAQKLAVQGLAGLGIAPQLATERVQFALLTSPGVALLAATLVTAWRHIDGQLAASVARRAWRPVAAISLFMLTARVLVECGAIAALAGTVTGLGRSVAIIAVTLLGGAGGFITGSGVTGNALFMPSAAAVGRALGNLPAFAALQNGASGHAAIASLPIAAVLVAAMPDRKSDDERQALASGLALSAMHLVVLCLVALWLV